MSDIKETLNERGERYGDFTDHASIADELITTVESSRNWKIMPAYMRHAIRYILDKVARTVTGDWKYTDNPHDIKGYADLMEERLEKLKANPNEKTLEKISIPHA